MSRAKYVKLCIWRQSACMVVGRRIMLRMFNVYELLLNIVQPLEKHFSLVKMNETETKRYRHSVHN